MCVGAGVGGGVGVGGGGSDGVYVPVDMTPWPCACAHGPKKSPPQLIATMSCPYVDERELRNPPQFSPTPTRVPKELQQKEHDCHPHPLHLLNSHAPLNRDTLARTATAKSLWSAEQSGP